MDELLLKRAQQDDPDAFEQLMTGLEQMVWRVCWHYTGNREDASDCGQETMVKVWKNLKAYRGECAFETWVYRIAANCCMDFLRKRKSEKSVSLEPLKDEGFDPPDESPGTEESAVIRDEHARLREAIAGLPEEQRDILVMTQLEGRSYEETARLLRISEGTVKSRLNRAREKLREIISGERELSGPASVQKSERRARR